MNQERFDQWCALLTSGEIPQADGKLVDVHAFSDTPAMCCLGVGMKAMGKEPEGEGFRMKAYHSNIGRYETVVSNSLPSVEFFVWLGFFTDEQATAIIEGGTSTGDLKVQFHDFDVFIDGDPQYTESIITSEFSTCAGMNDQGFTFNQIVDCMRYFGIEPYGSGIPALTT